MGSRSILFGKCTENALNEILKGSLGPNEWAIVTWGGWIADTICYAKYDAKLQRHQHFFQFHFFQTKRNENEHEFHEGDGRFIFNVNR